MGWARSYSQGWLNHYGEGSQRRRSYHLCKCRSDREFKAYHPIAQRACSPFCPAEQHFAVDDNLRSSDASRPGRSGNSIKPTVKPRYLWKHLRFVHSVNERRFFVETPAVQFHCPAASAAVALGGQNQGGAGLAVSDEQVVKPKSADVATDGSCKRSGRSYLSGFGNLHQSEALVGALPVGQNSPQKPPLGLLAEHISGTAFTAPRAEN